MKMFLYDSDHAEEYGTVLERLEPSELSPSDVLLLSTAYAGVDRVNCNKRHM